MSIRRSLFGVLLTASLLAMLCVGQLTMVAPAGAAGAQVSLGEDFSLLVKPDGSLFAWGINNFGQLGLGGLSSRTRPTRVGADVDWATLAAGDWHVLALKTNGSLWSWGDNRDGRLGLGDTEVRMVPTRVGTATDWQAIAAGDHFSLALKSDGTLWSWGANPFGQLGLGDTADRLEPTLVNLDADWAGISAGRYFAAATKTDGTLWTWGRNDKSQLGVGGTTNSSLPQQVGTDADWSRAVCGDADVRALKQAGSLFAWGFNDYGQLGLGDTATRQTPTPVGAATDWELLSCGDDTTMATRSGDLYAWGDNTYGQLGQGDRVHLSAPAQVGSDSDWVMIASGDDHSAGIRADDGLWVWGDNVFAQLGLGDTTDRLTPTLAFYADDVTAPTITSLTSPSHPDDTAWYADSTPSFEWSASADVSGVYGYGFLIDGSLYTIPDTRTTGTAPSWTANPTADGAWYFHVRAADAAGNWGPMARRRVKIDTTGPVTTDDAPSGWKKTPVTVHLSAVDAGAGVASTEYKVDGGSWIGGTQVTVSTEGSHTIAYRSTDVLGNVEANKACTAKIDTTAPVTTDDAPSGWKKTPVTVHLSAVDGGAGVASTEYSIDGGSWIGGTQVTVSTQGSHTIAYRSSDAAGNLETAQECSVSVDTRRPTPKAPKASSVRRGARASLAYTIVDARPGSPTATVTLKVKTLGGRTVKTVTLLKRTVNTPLTYTFRCTLAKKTYKFYVYAKDTAGNAQLKPAVNKLVVR